MSFANMFPSGAFRRKAAFRYPLPKMPRTAVLVDWFYHPLFRRLFRDQEEIRTFPRGWSAEVARFAPASVVGTREQLLGLVDSAEAWPTHALIALARPGDALLTAADRDQLWHAFHVPIFEQMIGEDGTLLASECEAHDGLHIESREARWEGDRYMIERQPCACGLQSPRLSALKPAERVRSAAVYAR